MSLVHTTQGNPGSPRVSFNPGGELFLPHLIMKCCSVDTNLVWSQVNKHAPWYYISLSVLFFLVLMNSFLLTRQWTQFCMVSFFVRIPSPSTFLNKIVWQMALALLGVSSLCNFQMKMLMHSGWTQMLVDLGLVHTAHYVCSELNCRE